MSSYLFQVKSNAARINKKSVEDHENKVQKERKRQNLLIQEVENQKIQT